MIPIPRGYRRLEWSEHKPARGLGGESAQAAPVPLMRGVRRPVRRGPCGLDQVANFAKRLSVGETHVARRSVSVSGTVRQMEKAFGVTLQENTS